MASARLHLGHFRAYAAAHLAQNMVFQHKMGPEIAPVQRKVMFSIIRVGCVALDAQNMVLCDIDGPLAN
mgnify:CR=1 FL=1